MNKNWKNNGTSIITKENAWFDQNDKIYQEDSWEIKVESALYDIVEQLKESPKSVTELYNNDMEWTYDNTELTTEYFILAMLDILIERKYVVKSRRTTLPMYSLTQLGWIAYDQEDEEEEYMAGDGSEEFANCGRWIGN